MNTNNNQFVVTAVQGKVLLIKADGTVLLLKAGDKISANDLIFSANDNDLAQGSAMVSVVLADGSVAIIHDGLFMVTPSGFEPEFDIHHLTDDVSLQQKIVVDTIDLEKLADELHTEEYGHGHHQVVTVDPSGLTGHVETSFDSGLPFSREFNVVTEEFNPLGIPPSAATFNFSTQESSVSVVAPQSTPVAPFVELELSKTDLSATAIPGSETTFKIIVSNSGTEGITEVHVNDNVGNIFFSGDSWTATATGGASGFTLSSTGNIHDIVDLPAGSSITYLVTANIPANETGIVSNSANLTSTVTNLDATATVPLTPAGDLVVTKTDVVYQDHMTTGLAGAGNGKPESDTPFSNPSAFNATHTALPDSGTAVPGDDIIYTVTVTNSGPSDATGVHVTDLITHDTGLSQFIWEASQTGGASGFTLAGNGDINDSDVNMPSGSTITYQIYAEINSDASGVLSNTATVTPLNTFIDTNPANNIATDVSILTPESDLAIEKSDTSNQIGIPGTQETFTLTVTNTGPSDSALTTVTDTIPAGFIVDLAATNLANGTITATESSNIVTFSNFDLLANQSITLDLIGNIDPSAINSLINTASVNIPNGDNTLLDNSSTDTVNLTPTINLSVTKLDAEFQDLNPTEGAKNDSNIGKDDFPNASGNLNSDHAVINSFGQNHIVIPGEDLVYKITLTDNGPSALVNGTITDSMPAQLISWEVFQSNGSPFNTAITGTGAQSFSINDINLGVNQTATYYVVGEVDPNAQDGATIFNQVSVTENGATINNGNFSDTDTIHTIELSSSKLDIEFIDTNSNDEGANENSLDTSTLGGTDGLDRISVIGINSVTLLDHRAVNGGIFSTKNTVIPGEDLVYKIQIDNTGQAPVINGILSDTLPTDIFSSWQVVDSTGKTVLDHGTGTSIIIKGVDIAPGDSATYYVIGEVGTTAAAGNFTDTGSLTLTGLSVNGGTFTDNDSLSNPNSAPVLAITIADIPDSSPDPSVIAGANITYQIIVSNLGGQDATGVVVADTLPVQGLQNISSPDTFFNPSNDTWDIGIVHPGAGNSVTLTLSGTIPTVTGTTYSNSVTATANNASTVTATDSDTLIQHATLAVTIVDIPDISPDPGVLVGNNISYQIVVTNNGPSDATGVTVVDTLPIQGLDNISSSAPFFNSATDTWNIGTIHPGAGNNVTFTLNGTIPTGATGNTYSNSVTASATDASSVTATDTDTLNHAALAITIVDVPDLSPDSVNAGNNISYQIVVTNNGPSDATGITVVDTLPIQGLDNLSSPNTSFNSATDTWSIGTIHPGAGNSVTFTLNGTIPAGALGTTYSDSVTASATNANSVTATDADTLIPQVILTITKSDNLDTQSQDPSLISGNHVTYQIVVNDTGIVNAHNVMVSDLLPGLGLDNISSPDASFNSATNSWDVGTVVPNTPITLTLDGTIPTDATGNYTNNANATANNASSVTTANTDTLIQQSDLAITNGVDHSIAYPGEVLDFSLGVSNLGLSDASGVVVTDTLPVSLINITDISNGGVFDAGTDTITWNLGSLTANTSLDLDFKATLNTENLTNPITTNASVTSSITDPNLTNNSASANFNFEVPVAHDLTEQIAIQPPQTFVGNIIAETNSSFGLLGTGYLQSIGLTGDSVTYSFNPLTNSVTPEGSGNPSFTFDPTNEFLSINSSLGTLSVYVENTASHSVGDYSYTPTSVQFEQPIQFSISDTANNFASANLTLTNQVLSNNEVVATNSSTSAQGIIVTLVDENNPHNSEAIFMTVQPTTGSNVDTMSFENSSNNFFLIGTDKYVVNIEAASSNNAAVTIDNLSIGGVTLQNTPLTFNNPHGINISGPFAETYVFQPNGIIEQTGVNSFEQNIKALGPPDQSHVYDLFGEVFGVIAVNKTINADSSLGAPTDGFGEFLNGNDDKAALSLNGSTLSSLPSVMLFNPNNSESYNGNGFDILRIDQGVLGDNNADLRGNGNIHNIGEILVTDLANNANSGSGTTLTLTANDVFNFTGGTNSSNNNTLFINDNLSDSIILPDFSLWTQHGAMNGYVVLTQTISINNTPHTVTLDIPAVGGASSSPEFTNPVIANPQAILTINSADSLDTQSQDPSLISGDHVSYQIVVNNIGNVNAQNVIVSDVLPSQGLNNISSPDASFNSATNSWDLGSVAPNTAITLTLNGTIPTDATGNYTNNASAMANNASSVTTMDTDTLTQQSDLAITNVVDHSVAYPGEVLDFTVGVSNLGLSDASGVVVTDTLPASLINITEISNSGVFDPGTDTITWNLGSLSANTLIDLDFKATLNTQNLTDTMTNNTSVTASTTDPNLTNNSASANFHFETPVAQNLTEEIATQPPETFTGNIIAETNSSFGLLGTGFLQSIALGDGFTYAFNPNVSNTIIQEGSGSSTFSFDPVNELLTVTSSSGTLSVYMENTIGHSVGDYSFSPAIAQYDQPIQFTISDVANNQSTATVTLTDEVLSNNEVVATNSSASAQGIIVTLVDETNPHNSEAIFMTVQPTTGSNVDSITFANSNDNIFLIGSDKYVVNIEAASTNNAAVTIDNLSIDGVTLQSTPVTFNNPNGTNISGPFAETYVFQPIDIIEQTGINSFGDTLRTLTAPDTAHVYYLFGEVYGLVALNQTINTDLGGNGNPLMPPTDGFGEFLNGNDDKVVLALNGSTASSLPSVMLFNPNNSGENYNGNGFDILRIDQGALGNNNVNLQGNGNIHNIGEILVTDTSNNTTPGSGTTLTLTANDVLNFTENAAQNATGNSNTLVINGNASDTVHTGSGWTDNGVNASGFDILTQTVSGHALTLAIQHSVAHLA